MAENLRKACSHKPEKEVSSDSQLAQAFSSSASFAQTVYNLEVLSNDSLFIVARVYRVAEPAQMCTQLNLDCSNSYLYNYVIVLACPRKKRVFST